MKWANRGRFVAVLCTSVIVVAAPALSASASVSPTSRGQDPTSPFCKAERANAGAIAENRAAEVKLSQALDSGHWTSAKALYLSMIQRTLRVDRSLESMHGAVPRKIQTALPLMIKYMTTMLSAAETSKSESVFEARTNSATSQAEAGANTAFPIDVVNLCGGTYQTGAYAHP
jgi:hypothetical protein